MRILYLTGQIKYHGGIEKVLSLKMNYLAESLGYPLSPKIIHDDLHLDYDIAIHKKGLFAPKNIIKGVKHFFLLKRKLREISPDVVILPNGGYDFYFLPFIKKIFLKYEKFIHPSIKEGKHFIFRLDAQYSQTYLCAVTC